jgi:nitroreductase
VLKKLKSFVKNALAVSWVRQSYVNINKAILSVFSSNRVFATVYAFVGALTFNREQYAVLRGRSNYYRNLTRERATHVELRRNIHRLEKGITMQPRRPVFARDYIDETIDFYEEAIKQYKENEDSLDRMELEWAHDTLKAYFTLAAADDRIVKQARERYEESLKHFTVNNEVEKSPFLREDGAKANVSYDDMLGLAMRRRSVRWFQQKKVPRELIDKAMMIGRQAPTACNRLPYEFRIFDDPEMVKKVAGIPFGAAGYAHQVPTIIVVIGKLDSYFSPRDRHAIYVDSSLAAMSFMFGLETLGLSSSVINWPDFEPLEAKMQKTLNLDPSERVIMLMAVGYADPKGGIPFSQKKSLDVLRSYNVLKK